MFLVLKKNYLGLVLLLVLVSFSPSKSRAMESLTIKIDEGTIRALSLGIVPIKETFATNVFGLTMLTQEVVKFFKTQQYGTIINIGSSASLNGFPSGSVYCASKFALRGLTECWRHELRRDNIRVILINPSEVTTAFNNKKRIERNEEENKLTSKEIAHAIVSAIKMDKRGFIPELNVWATNPF